MMLQNLSLINFKNHQTVELNFNAKANLICGNNGIGKTAILDAIHYLCLCKSYFNPIDSQQIRYGEEFFVINGIFEQQEKSYSITCGVKKNQKKSFKINKREYERLADHIGLFPLVAITPYDITLILDGSEERRKFMDSVISQNDSSYLDTLIQYNKALQNRNSLLKQIADTHRYDPTLLEIFDERLADLGQKIYRKRTDFLEELVTHFNHYYHFLSDHQEAIYFEYQSQLHQSDLKTLLQKSFEKDSVLERTSSGIHKDDLVFTIDGMPIKRFASQGQQKTFLIALKLAQYAYLKDKKKVSPLLLLDDIFDKLDHERIQRLVELVSGDMFGQIFITDTEGARIETICQQANIDFSIFNLPLA